MVVQHDSDQDKVVWPFWEPVQIRERGTTVQTWVGYVCPFDGWHGTPVRPEEAGTFVRICTEAQAHLDTVHHGRWAAA